MERADVMGRLAYLSRLDRKREYFGAKAHEYRLRPVAEDGQVAAIEEKRHFSLPAEYRHFITSLGNGGAGPYHGIYPLGLEHSPRALAEWNDQLLGDLSKPFPHRKEWNLPQEFWAGQPDPPPDTPIEEERRLMDAWDARLAEQYWTPSVVNGAVPIADIGCALTIVLVVTGPEAGTVWEDRRAEDAGIRPVLDKSGAHLTFAFWYMQWLDEGIVQFGGDPRVIPPPPQSWWQRMFGASS